MIHLFYCSNCLTDSELVRLRTRFGTEVVAALSLPCSGKMTIPYLLKAFEKGADGVVICACPETECKHLEGNLRASKRIDAVDGLIDEIGLGKGRVSMVTKKHGQIDEVIDSVQRLQEEISSLKSEVSCGERALRTSRFALPTSKEHAA
jgi:coenzyme F420-reducing hydrogenase delta subunit